MSTLIEFIVSIMTDMYILKSVEINDLHRQGKISILKASSYMAIVAVVGALILVLTAAGDKSIQEKLFFVLGAGGVAFSITAVALFVFSFLRDKSKDMHQ